MTDQPKTIGLVLLSGGMDSVALLYHSQQRHDHTEALFVDYGQPAAAVERAAAHRAAANVGVSISERSTQFVSGVIGAEPPPAGMNCGVNTASMPARNAVFVAGAASFAAFKWGNARAYTNGKSPKCSILLGATFNDQRGFADCRPLFQAAASEMVAAATRGLLNCCVVFPFVRLTKSMLLERASKKWPGAEEAMRASVSCYRGDGCGTCSACVIRARAFCRWEALSG